MKIYKVGGAVRDEFLGRTPKDYDYAVEGFFSFESMVEGLKNLGVEIVHLHKEFYTVRGKFEKKYNDYVWCRKDGEYLDGDLLNVFPGNIWDDLARRDFTINAIAIANDTGEILDPFNGRQDLENKIIGCVGDPRKRFLEHPIRMLRALRFSVTLGFSIDPNIEECFKDPDLLEFISKDKFLNLRREELNKTFKASTLDAVYLLGNKYPLLAEACFHSLKAQFTSKNL